MIPRLTHRAPRSRPVRANTGDPRLESLAAEFALLAQRRSRAIHQIATLDQQRSAALHSFARLQRRVDWLMEQMTALSADTQEQAEPEPEPRLQYVAKGHPVKPAPKAYGDALAAIGRKWVAAQPSQMDRPAPNRRSKRH